MNQICAWCGVKLNPFDEQSPRNMLSHGICAACANSEMMKIPLKLRDFLDEIEAPIIIVDAQGVVTVANRNAKILLRKQLAEIEGRLGGDVFECAYSRLPEGCGNTVHCSGCTIRRTVMETHATGKGVVRRPATLKQQANCTPTDIHFHVTTEKFNDYVMLRIDP